ncbi:MAG: PQQ-dependent dehydrogenase, methanol/ethanol family [Acidobacteriota bacterium]
MKPALALLATAALFAQGLPVTYERIRNAAREPGNWLTYSATYDSWRFSPLTQITTANVGRLHVKWIFQARTQEKFESTPLVVDGIMYLTRPENDIYALDAVTGRVLWTYSYRNPERTFNCCGKVNRGLSILGDKLFMNTLDMHVVAVDAKSGRELWKTKMYDYSAAGGYAASGAPLVVKDKLIVGMAGGEHGVSGFLDAYDTETGKHLWRFNTIPQPGEPNFGTWAGDSWKTGGASTWNNGSYDPELNLVYWGTSNPWPDYNGDFRKGDNLYSCSVLALDADTGTLKWFYQFTPHDLHDWDATQIPVLFNGEYGGKPRKLMAWPNRNGFYYLLDRSTGEFLKAKAFVRQTWVKGFDDKGRPETIPGNEPTDEGNDRVFPGVDGAANWMSPSYSPLTKLLYVFAREERRIFTKNAVRHPTTAADEGDFNRAGPTVRRRAPRFAPEESWGKVSAIDPLTGDEKWQHKVVSPPWGGVMATAGNLVFGGTLEGVVFALDARTGERLWHFMGNDRVYSAPISFLAGGKQLVSLPVGDVLITFGLD